MSVPLPESAYPGIEWLPQRIPVPTHYVGICDECRQAKPFHSERERDLWSRNHAHQEDPA